MSNDHETTARIEALEQKVALFEILLRPDAISRLEGIIAPISDYALRKGVDPDWLDLFYDRAKHISDERTQDVFANVIVDEANRPGTYSKRFLMDLSLMEKAEIDVLLRAFAKGGDAA